ncbi:MAG: type I glutamate--ammonia ligase [Eubacterium sp.]|nr:type I glutamate--ammonia ligase [Eubacterium sp.]
MGHYTKEDILRIVEEEGVAFIRLQFTDLLGTLKNVAITKNQLERALNNQYVFDGSSIEGFARVEEADMYLYPDTDTFLIFPWSTPEGKVARIICDVYNLNEKPYKGDPRGVLKRVVAEAKEMGYEFQVGPECEFFLMNTDADGNPITETKERAGYFELGPNDFGEDARRDIVLTMEELGCEIESSHHEVAAGQHEVDLKYREALGIADDFMTLKLAIKTVAKNHGMFASFMPKPKADVAGSGVHLNMSLTRDGENIFYDEQGRYGLSKEAYYFMGGIMKHIQAMTMILNPLVNSYKRLVPGYEAPTDIAWSFSNRTPLIRVPLVKDANKRIELRSPDPSMNPYLALALCLAAGLDGIKNQIKPPAEVQMNVFAMSEAEKETLNIAAMPESLKDAIEAFEADLFVQDVLGSHICKKLLQMKKQEWFTYRSKVTNWEIEEYLYKF